MGALLLLQANVEIREEGGEDTMFIFGALEHEVAGIQDPGEQGKSDPIHSMPQADVFGLCLHI